MAVLIVVDHPERWALRIPDVELVAARAYLTDASFSNRRGDVVFNLCRSYGYQTSGYYVSLLAEARGHRPKPSVATLQDLRGNVSTRVVSEDLGALIEKALAPIKSDRFELSVYFGQPLAARYKRLALALFNQFPAPLLRATFVRDGEWELAGVGPIPASSIPPSHLEFVEQAATGYFAARRWSTRARARPRAHLAILADPREAEPPSNEQALRRFERAAHQLGLATQRLTRQDFARLGEFDALFIRETTAVNHHTWRFARRAAAEGMVVIDDPVSIIRCTNKVFMKELLERNRVAIPRTLIVHKHNRHEVQASLGLPCVLKQPDSAFSVGVVKAEDEESLDDHLDRLLKASELIVAQEFVPTDFDWRVGVFDRQPLYACRYFMARKHWQILQHEEGHPTRYGRVETIPVEDAPPVVVRTALRAANLVGDGLYGVDLKMTGKRCVVMEVNDNPSIESGFEDLHLKDELYRRIMAGFLERIESRRGRSA